MFVRVTVENNGLQEFSFQRDIAECCKGLVTSEITATGEKLNLASEPASFVTMVIHYGADLGIGLLAHYLYDLAKRKNLQVKLNGTDLKSLSVIDVAQFLEAKVTEPLSTVADGLVDSDSESK